MLTSLLYKLLSPLYLPYFIERRLAGLGERPRLRTVQPMVGELVIQILERAKSVAGERDHKMSILSVLDPKDSTELKMYCEKAGINLVALSFDNAEKKDLVISEHDAHWNARANDIIGKQLINELNVNLCIDGSRACAVLGQ